MKFDKLFTSFRFLLPYERHTRAKEERKKKKKGDLDKVKAFLDNSAIIIILSFKIELPNNNVTK